MVSNQYNKLYESIMLDVSKLVYYSINEAYDNALLEEFQVKDFINGVLNKSKNALDNEIKKNNKDIQQDTSELYAILRKLIVVILQDIKKKKGVAGIAEFVSNFRKEISYQKSVMPKELLQALKTATLALGIFSVGYFMNTVKTVKDEVLSNTQNLEVVVNKAPTKDIKKNTKTITPVKQQVNQKTEETAKEETILPTEYASTVSKNDMYMFPSEDCQNFIKHDEVLCQFPYFATKRENRMGMITIGWGHVICDNWRNPASAWYFPDNMSAARKKEIKDAIIKYAKSGDIIQSLVKENSKGVKYNTRISKNMKDLITLEEAKMFFNYDLQKADKRVRITLGIVNSTSSKFNGNRTINNNVKYYCYYNQNIYDMMLSCAFNCGAWKENVPFILTLMRCRYDKENNCINQSDFLLACKKFKLGNGNNLDRRAKEYEAFVRQEADSLRNFNDVI